MGQSCHDKHQGILAFARTNNSFHFIASALISAELLLVCSVDIWILRWPAQSLAREANILPRAKVLVPGVDVDAVCTYAFKVAAVILFVFFNLSNQISVFIIRVSADSMEEWEAILNRDANFRPELDSSTSLATNDWPHLPLNQINQTIWDTTRFACDQNALLPAQLTASTELVPPMALEAGKPCSSTIRASIAS